MHRDVGCCDPLDCGPCCEGCPTCPSEIRIRQRRDPWSSWRHRLANRLTGGELFAVRGRVRQGERALATALDGETRAREAARKTQGRLAELRQANVTRDRQVRAVHLAETLLDRFRERGAVPGIAVATVDAVTLATWHSLLDELARPAPELDAAVADREPLQPAFVHPGTDSEVADA
ncbi:hypothetical protein GCM10023201_41320 [Actinomycetospora corticicola]|uniref:Uncharacterized protein n=1 Tax=Actinomycetospora corticicola TaxID=663602 RepID=A0A7Y9DWN7_9PSEU|nr:hypothetical protein [Actinomycetospora corticicola]NYD36781.1 hypothetical protein [Actinomycetospora corticicola]